MNINKILAVVAFASQLAFGVLLAMVVLCALGKIHSYPNEVVFACVTSVYLVSLPAMLVTEIRTERKFED